MELGAARPCLSRPSPGPLWSDVQRASGREPRLRAASFPQQDLEIHVRMKAVGAARRTERRWRATQAGRAPRVRHSVWHCRRRCPGSSVSPWQRGSTRFQRHRVTSCYLPRSFLEPP